MTVESRLNTPPHGAEDTKFENTSIHGGNQPYPTGDDVVLDEDQLSVAQTLIKNPIVVLCALYGNLGALMYGFDNITLSLCLDMPVFLEQFGILTDGTYAIPAYWQSLWNAIPQLTTGIGAWISGPISERVGRKWTLLIAGILSAIGVSVIYTAYTRPIFLVGKLINSLGLGMALATGQTYVSEITPTKIRGIALAVYTVCLAIGYLIAACISSSRVTIPDESAFRDIFAAEWCWPGLLIIGALLVPESPYYLVRTKQPEAAANSLAKLHRGSSWIQTQTRLQKIQQAIHHEEGLAAGAGASEAGFIECFQGTNWRRTRIVLYSNGLSQMTGATFINNSPYFMIVAGLSPTQAAMIIEVGIAMSIFSSILTCWAMARIGRRPIVLSGIALAAVLFFIMGLTASLPNQNSSSLWCVAITLQMVWLSIGPANGPALSVAAEVSSIRLRAKTLAIGFFFNYVWSAVWNIVVPYMFNADQGNLGGKMGWIFMATCIISFVLLWFEMPETKDLSFEQIDRRFETHVHARCFTSADVDRAASAAKDDIALGKIQQIENA